jgi:hypothetical protein
LQVLINRCAKYICYDMTDSLGENWMDRMKESPRLMLQIIKNLRGVHENKLHEIRRMEAGIEQWVHGGRVNAVAFEVDAKVILNCYFHFHVFIILQVWLRGIGLFGAKDGSKFTVNIKVFLNDDCLLEETIEYSSNHSASPVKLILSSPVKIKPNKRCPSLHCRTVPCSCQVRHHNRTDWRTNVVWKECPQSEETTTNTNILILGNCCNNEPQVVSSTGVSGNTFDVTFFTSPLGPVTHGPHVLIAPFLRPERWRDGDGPAALPLLQVAACHHFKHCSDACALQ